MSTAYPALLSMLDTELGESDWNQISSTLESYLVRRAVCNLTTKNYNRVFLGLIRYLSQNGSNFDNVGLYLTGLTGDSVEWPSDEVFLHAWLTGQAYMLLDNRKLVHIFRRLNDTYYSDKNERLDIHSPLSIEHLMPRGWRDKWVLPDGSKGLTYEEMSEMDDSDPKVQATRGRDSAIHTMGNLTVLSQSLNSAVSDSPWAEKNHNSSRLRYYPLTYGSTPTNIGTKELYWNVAGNCLSEQNLFGPSPLLSNCLNSVPYGFPTSIWHGQSCRLDPPLLPPIGSMLSEQFFLWTTNATNTESG